MNHYFLDGYYVEKLRYDIIEDAVKSWDFISHTTYAFMFAHKLVQNIGNVYTDMTLMDQSHLWHNYYCAYVIESQISHHQYVLFIDVEEQTENKNTSREGKATYVVTIKLTDAKFKNMVIVKSSVANTNTQLFHNSDTAHNIFEIIQKTKYQIKKEYDL